MRTLTLLEMPNEVLSLRNVKTNLNLTFSKIERRSVQFVSRDRVVPVKTKRLIPCSLNSKSEARSILETSRHEAVSCNNGDSVTCITVVCLQAVRKFIALSFCSGDM